MSSIIIIVVVVVLVDLVIISQESFSQRNGQIYDNSGE